MEKYFVTYNQALALKELGFNEPCFAKFFKVEDEKEIFMYYTVPSISDTDVTINIPTFSQCFRWFREKYKLEYCIDFNFRNDKYIFQAWNGRECLLDYYNIDTYEEAEQECLKQLIKIVKDEQQ